MRNAILAMTMALTLVTGQLRAATHKILPADVGPGRIAWFRITTPNLPQSKEFYGKLFDWQPRCRAPIRLPKSSRVAPPSGRYALLRARSARSTA